MGFCLVRLVEAEGFAKGCHRGQGSSRTGSAGPCCDKHKRTPLAAVVQARLRILRRKGYKIATVGSA